MAKLEIQHAFRLCPVRSADWHLLGMFWNQQYFIDTRLPFGSRSSPYIFNTFADALAWILVFVFSVPYVIHYLDDFFIADSAISNKTAKYMNTIKSAFTWLGVPLAPDKIIGPATCITYLGIDIDSSSFEIHLPNDKLRELRSMLVGWSKQKSCTKRDLLSLIGSLSFAAKVIKPGRLFLRRLIKLSTSVHLLHHHIYLNKEAHLDIIWWKTFINDWNGISIIQNPITSVTQISLFTDASAVGFGAVFGNQWFSCKWPNNFPDYDINVKELFAVTATIFTWGHLLTNQQILLYSDNRTVCDVWLSTSSKDCNIMFYLRHVFMFAAKLNINLLIKHVPGHYNSLADALSRLQVAKFLTLHPQAAVTPTPINLAIWKLSNDL